MISPALDFDDIQGDVLQGLQKNAETFLFFRIADPRQFKTIVRQYVVTRIVSARRVQQRELLIESYALRNQKHKESFPGINLGFTRDGLNQLVGAGGPTLDPAFDRGADHPDTVAALYDPPKSRWLAKFVADRIDGAFLVTGPNASVVTFHTNELLRCLGSSINVPVQLSQVHEMFWI